MWVVLPKHPLPRYDEGYSESQYRTDLAKAQSGGYDQTSRQFKDIQAGASYGPFSGSLRFTTDNSQSSSSRYMSAESFGDYSAQASAMKSSSCESSSSQAQSRQAASVLQQTIDPNIVAAYVSCLDLYRVGIQTKTSSAYDAQNLALDIKFAGQTASSRARITGITILPEGSATCTVTAVTGATTPRPFAAVITMLPNQGVTVVCTVVASKAPANKRSDILITTDLGGTWRGMLFHTPDVSEVAKLSLEVKRTQSDNQRLRNQIVTITSNATATSARVAQAERDAAAAATRLAQVERDAASTATKLAQVERDAAATAAKVSQVGIDGRQITAASICLGPSNSGGKNICMVFDTSVGGDSYTGVMFRSQDGRRNFMGLWDSNADIMAVWNKGMKSYMFFNNNADVGVCTPPACRSAM